MPSVRVLPACTDTQVIMELQIYDYDTDGSSKDCSVSLTGVCALNFSLNCFDNMIGAELFGFFEYFDIEKKKALVEKNFICRREEFLSTGDYVDFDPNDGSDILNYRPTVDDVLLHIDEYRLFQLQSTGGIYTILAKGISVQEKE